MCTIIEFKREDSIDDVFYQNKRMISGDYEPSVMDTLDMLLEACNELDGAIVMEEKSYE